MRPVFAGQPGWLPLPTATPGLYAEASRASWAGVSGTPQWGSTED